MLARLEALEAKFAAMGQDMPAYLDGLLHADYLTYWRYIHLDTLLSLQQPLTPIPDERIFIIYHQITELYFRLILDAIEQILPPNAPPSVPLFKRQLERINRYFEQLINSYDVMVDGMDKSEFMRFRMSLLPASGFQSAQFRKIEVYSTAVYQLLHHTKREEMQSETDFAKCYEAFYWKFGATELATGKKTLTLKQFEAKYAQEIIELSEKMQDSNLYKLFLNFSETDRADPELRNLLREHDLNVNVRWRLSHFRSAVRYLESKPQHIAATGGTNWQQYLPPKNQLVVFFPTLWSENELENWGKNFSVKS